MEAILFQFFLFSNSWIFFFGNISSEHCCSGKSLLFCTEMKCSLGFSACRCTVICLLTVSGSEDFICNTDLKLKNVKGG